MTHKQQIIWIIHWKFQCTPKGDAGSGPNNEFVLQQFFFFLHIYLCKYLFVTVMSIVTTVSNIVVSILVYFSPIFFPSL